MSYPLLLDVSDRLVVIVGGGTVAARKAGGLLGAGATRVKVVAPTFGRGLPAGVERVAEAYEERHLDGAALAFAATDVPAVNDRVVRDARAHGVLVNRADADDDAPGDFVTPALLRRGAVTVGVSAGSAALAAALRDALAVTLDERYVKMADAMLVLRPAIRDAAGFPAARRRDVFRALATPEAIDLLDQAGIDALTDWLGQRFPEIGAGSREPEAGSQESERA